MIQSHVQAIAMLESAGYVVRRRKSHEHTLRSLDRARNDVEWEKRFRKTVEKWAQEAHQEQRRLADRLTFVYGVARAHGATEEELSGG